MNPLFIAGTDTDVGKTFVTAQLVAQAQALGICVTTQKWIQSGLGPHGETDLDQHHAPDDTLNIEDRMPYVFPFPASPHLSAERQDAVIHDDRLFSATDHLRSRGYWVLIEGSGGVLVPHRRQAFMIDLLTHYQPTVLIVAANRLGVLNHTFLTVEALQTRHISVAGILLNDGAPGCHQMDSIIQADNYALLQTTLNLPVYRLTDTETLSQQVVSSLFRACKEAS